MATVKQRKAVEFMVENGGVASKAMIAAGYSPATAINPNKLTDSKGFDELCAKVGLTDDFVLQALKDDIRDKPRRRHNELNLASEIRGLKKHKNQEPETPTNVITIIGIDTTLRSLIQKASQTREIDDSATEDTKDE